MTHKVCPGLRKCGQFHLLALSVGIAIASFAATSYNHEQAIAGLPEVIVPLGFATVLGLVSLKLQLQDYDSEFVSTIVTHSWAGGLIAAAISGWWVVLHYAYEMPLVGLPQEVLTIACGGFGAGLVVSYARTETHTSAPDTEIDGRFTQTTWTNRDGDTPIQFAIVDALAEIEQCDPLDIEPLYEHTELDVLTDLRAHEGSPWKFGFHTDEYVIEVSSAGTVTIYDAETSRLQPTPQILSEEDAEQPGHNE